jgi:signal transduction histidine kinase
MPELDGPGLLRRIRATPRPNYVYAILLTAKSQKEDLVEGMEAGADDFLTKPFDRDELRVRLSAGERIIRLEQSLRDTQAALIQTDKLASLGRLAAGMAHEINNPLAFVINNLAVLKRDGLAALNLLEAHQATHERLASERPDLPVDSALDKAASDSVLTLDDFHRLMGSSAEGLKRIRAIVQNLRDFARLDEAEYNVIDINAAIRTTIEALRHELTQKDIHVELALQPLPPVACYPGKLNQVFLNILRNAIQASSHGGRIEIRSHPIEQDAIQIEIADHGEGIRPEHLPHIFEPFWTTREVGAGAGLGLSVGYGIIRDHAGELRARSIPGEGSVFEIRLPLRSPEPVIPTGAAGKS